MYTIKQPEMNTIDQMISRCKLVFDVGANLGLKAQKYLDLGAKVICFEPQPDCVRELHQRFSGNENVRIVPKAVAEHNGSLRMAVCSEANTISTFSEKWKLGRFSNYTWDKAINVNVITLDRAIQTFGRPDYCKIDVEGYELEVLCGLTQTVPLLSFEFVEEDLQRMEKCVSHLQELGFVYFNMVLGESESFKLYRWVCGAELVDYLKQIATELMWGDIYGMAADFRKRHFEDC